MPLDTPTLDTGWFRISPFEFRISLASDSLSVIGAKPNMQPRCFVPVGLFVADYLILSELALQGEKDQL